MIDHRELSEAARAVHRSLLSDDNLLELMAEPVAEGLFDDALHPRDRDGKFASVGALGRAIKSDRRVTLPDGLQVRRATGGFQVHARNGHQLSFHTQPQDAARAVLNRSARSTHPKSVGGTTKYSDVEAAQRGMRNSASRAKRAKISAMPGSHYRGSDGRLYTRVAGISEAEDDKASSKAKVFCVKDRTKVTPTDDGKCPKCGMSLKGAMKVREAAVLGVSEALSR